MCRSCLWDCNEYFAHSFCGLPMSLSSSELIILFYWISLQKVMKQYAFEIADIPAESEYLEVQYPVMSSLIFWDAQIFDLAWRIHGSCMFCRTSEIWPSAKYSSAKCDALSWP